MAFNAETLRLGIPIPVRETVSPTPSGPIVYDLERRLNPSPVVIQGHQFEAEGIAYLKSAIPPENIIIGPGLIDEAFRNRPVGENAPDWTAQGLPDAMVFKPSEDGFILEEIIEFKSGRDTESSKKIKQFQKLVDRLRLHPNDIKEALSLTLKPNTYIPNLIIPPTDEEIEVHFARRFTDTKNRELDTRFRVFYWTVPLLDAA